MPVYDVQLAHLDAMLTNVSIGYQNEEFVGERLFPPVPVTKQSDNYYVFGKEAFLPEDDERAPATVAHEIPGIEFSRTPYFCPERALQIPIADEERINADAPLSPDTDATEMLTDKILLAQEKRIADLAIATGTYASGFSATPTTKWDAASGTTIISDVRTGIKAIHAAIFKRPNTMILPYEVYTSLEDNSEFIDRIKYSERGIMTVDLLKEIFDIPNIYIAAAGYNSANRNQDESLAYVWGDNVVLAYVNQRPALKQPSFAYNFIWTMGIGTTTTERWREENRRADLVRVSKRYDHKVTCQKAGYLLSDVLT